MSDHSAPQPGRYPPVRLDGRSLTLADAARVAAGAPVEVARSSLERVRRGRDTADRLATVRPLYGRTTGVGANRDQSSDEDAPVDHGLAILRSHAAGWGPVLDPGLVRCGLGVRANQLLGGGSGAAPEVALALAELAGGDTAALPVVHRHGALGTSDLTALAEVGLTLLGERPRADGSRHRTLALRPVDALPLMSSHAFTIGEAALGCHALQGLSRAAEVICALSWLALNGSLEAIGPAVGTVTPFASAGEVARTMSRLLEGETVTPHHLQDFFGLRTWPQVHGPLLDALGHLRDVVERSANTSSENPVYLDTEPATAAHHGGFHAAYLALALDTTLLALTRSARSGQSRVGHLLTDPSLGLSRFLADEVEGSSGLLILEYSAGSALALIRGHASAPASVQTVSVSAGVEDDASFANLAAARLSAAVAAYRRLLAVELVCAVRALRLRGVVPAGALRPALEACSGLPEAVADRDLAPELLEAEDLVEALAGLVSAG